LLVTLKLHRVVWRLDGLTLTVALGDGVVGVAVGVGVGVGVTVTEPVGVGEDVTVAVGVTVDGASTKTVASAEQGRKRGPVKSLAENLKIYKPAF